MALTATIYTFDIELADTHRHLYESPALRLARHPSDSQAEPVPDSKRTLPAPFTRKSSGWK